MKPDEKWRVDSMSTSRFNLRDTCNFKRHLDRRYYNYRSSRRRTKSIGRGVLEDQFHTSEKELMSVLLNTPLVFYRDRLQRVFKKNSFIQY